MPRARLLGGSKRPRVYQVYCGPTYVIALHARIPSTDRGKKEVLVLNHDVALNTLVLELLAFAIFTMGLRTTNQKSFTVCS
jgi:hypothetical protein